MAYKKITQKQSDHIKHLYIDLNETLVNIESITGLTAYQLKTHIDAIGLKRRKVVQMSDDEKQAIAKNVLTIVQRFVKPGFNPTPNQNGLKVLKSCIYGGSWVDGGVSNKMAIYANIKSLALIYFRPRSTVAFEKCGMT